jgi:hypothetical protein
MDHGLRPRLPDDPHELKAGVLLSEIQGEKANADSFGRLDRTDPDDVEIIQAGQQART